MERRPKRAIPVGAHSFLRACLMAGLTKKFQFLPVVRTGSGSGPRGLPPPEVDGRADEDLDIADHVASDPAALDAQIDGNADGGLGEESGSHA